MKPSIIIATVISLVLNVGYTFSQVIESNCCCDKIAAEKIIRNEKINKFNFKKFNSLSGTENKLLWYTEIESPFKTKYTPLWNDYSSNNYRASQLDFINNYQEKKDVLLAFQFGPNADLWAYQTFVFRKVNDCFLATRTYFRHARFTYKSYAILNKAQVDSLYNLLVEQKVQTLVNIEPSAYSGYFIDNIKNRSFYINFENAQYLYPSEHDSNSLKVIFRPEVAKLNDFVYNNIKWIKTYPLLQK